jgi:hypothetical protein
MNWDFVVAVLIIGGLILTVWAKVSGMTIPDLLRSLKDLVSGGGEVVEERSEMIYG